MDENNDTPVQSVQADNSVQAAQADSIQAVLTGNMPLSEGYQPLPIERKGYQAVDAPPLQSPPQSITSDVPVAVDPPAGGNTAGAAASTQANSTTAAQASEQGK